MLCCASVPAEAARVRTVDGTPVRLVVDRASSGRLSSRVQQRLERRMRDRRTRNTLTRRRLRQRTNLTLTRQTTRRRTRARRSRTSLRRPVLVRTRTRSRRAIVQPTHSISQEVWSIVNEKRRSAGVPPLKYNLLLERAAQDHAQDMSVRKYLSGKNPEGQDAEARIKSAGYIRVNEEDCNCKSWTYKLAEVFARADGNAQQIVDYWMNDTATRSQLLSRSFTETGIGISGDIWVQSLGTITVIPKQSFTADQQKEFSAEVLRLTNEERAKRNLPALKRNALLDQSSLAHAKDMHTRKFFAHENPEGKVALDRIRSTGYLASTRGYAVGENIAKGQENPVEVMRGWMNSPGHRENILSDKYSEIGIGLYGEVWVQNFGDTTK